MRMVEDAALIAIRQAYSQSESINEAIALYKHQQKLKSPSPNDAALEMARIADALARVEQDEAATVQAQIAGMRAGASPHAYAAVFADLAARRKDLEDRRGVLARQRAAERGGAAEAPPKDMELTHRALEDAWRVLTDESVPGATKRRIIGTIVQRVVCQEERSKGRLRARPVWRGNRRRPFRGQPSNLLYHLHGVSSSSGSL